MTSKFNADEIFAIAEQIEVNGSKFYRAMASKINDRNAKSILEELAAMEDSHKLIFSSMRKELSRIGFEPFDPNGEVASYLSALADGKIFNLRNDPLALLGKKASTEDIFKFAIDMEKNSIIFYLGMKEVVSEKFGKEKIVDIIREEMSHVRILTGELKSMYK